MKSAVELMSVNLQQDILALRSTDRACAPARLAHKDSKGTYVLHERVQEHTR